MDVFIESEEELNVCQSMAMHNQKHLKKCNTLLEYENARFKNNEIDFKQLVDAYAELYVYSPYFYETHENEWSGHRMSHLIELLKNREFFENLIENNKLTLTDLRHLLRAIVEFNELEELCKNTSLIEKLLKNFVFDSKILKKYKDSIIDREEGFEKCDIFDFIEYWNKGNTEILKLNELNKIFWKLSFLNITLTKKQKIELAEILKDNEIASSRLKNIVDSHLESNFSFDQLIQYLKKQEKKSILNI